MKETDQLQKNQNVSFDNCDSSTPTEEWLRTEYELINERLMNATRMRRFGLAFFTSAQGALIGFIGSNFPILDLKGFAFAFFGIFITFIAWNNEKRIGSYMTGYVSRINEIEEKVNVKMMKYDRESANKSNAMSNRKLFTFYFIVILLSWITLLGYNFFIEYTS